MKTRTLFVKWLLLQALTVSFLAGLGHEYGDRIRGSSLVAVPVILCVFAWATSIGGRVCWRAGDKWMVVNRGPTSQLRHEAKYLNFYGWVCQILGIMATVFGFWLLFQGQGDLVARIQNGIGVALMGTFVGVFCSLVLAMEERMIEHDLGR